MNRLAEHSFRDNASTRDGWTSFGPHRRRVTDLIRGILPRAGARVCVLGAGNCNDLDLPALLAVHREVHLVDLDGDAVARGLGRQGLAAGPGLVVHGGLDVTGFLGRMAGWSPSAAVPDGELADCAAAAEGRAAAALPGPFDAVASTCVLSQLVRSVERALGEGHPRFLDAVRAVRAGHLRLLARLAAPGGAGLLVSDFVSSDTFPALGAIPEGALPSVLARLVAGGNFFHGTNPAVVAAALRAGPGAVAGVTGLEMVPPWLWDLGARVYAVYAIKFRLE